jgi:hypothetical protein
MQVPAALQRGEGCDRSHEALSRYTLPQTLTGFDEFAKCAPILDSPQLSPDTGQQHGLEKAGGPAHIRICRQCGL